ncbi:MAG: alpha/beta hydrolase [bacterium]|nr:alpha/beta hydrolase [bacterium]
MRLVRVVLLAMMFLAIMPIAAQTDAFEPTACPIEDMTLPDTVVDGEQIRCGLVTVPLFHDNPEAGTIKVGVAIIPSLSPNPAADPLVMVQGGPGGSGFTFFPQLILGAQYFIGDRDVIILEQRGTKFSQPDLVCEEGFELAREYLDDNLAPEEAYALSEAATIACFERLVSEGIDVAAFNSIENAADIPAVVTALGYSEFNFYGVSYGTMLGQHLLNLNPDGLRSVILDANVPLSQNFIPITGVSATRVFKLLFESCASNEACNATYPDLESKYFEVIARLQETPVIVNVTDPTDDSIRPALFNGEGVVSATFSAMYVPSLVQTMPRYITQMYEGNFAWIEKWGGQLFLQTDSAGGFYNTVMCAEDGDFTEADFPVDDMYPQFVAPFTRDTAKFAELCVKLGIPALDSAIADMTSTSEVPVLVTSGDFDPITPPAGGALIAESLPNAVHFVYPNSAHGALLGGACPVGMMTAFINNPTEALDDSCIADLAMDFLIYHDDASGLFSTPVPAGWNNVSTDTYTYFTDPVTESAIYGVSVTGDDVNVAIASALTVIDPAFTSAPLQSQEIDIAGEAWTNSVYLVGQGIRLALSKSESTDGGYVVIVIDVPTQEALTEVAPALDPVIIGLEYTNP